MKQTRRTLFAQNTQLQAQLTACGPDITMSRKQLRARLQAARSEVDMLTTRSASQAARIDALTAEIGALKEAAKKAAQPA